MLELHIDNNDVSGGSIPITWCVSKDVLQALEKMDCDNPAIVIMVKSSSDREWRKVVPMKDLLTWVEFHQPGTNKIFAFVHPNLRKAKKDFLEKCGKYRYEAYILQSSIECYGWYVKDLDFPDEMTSVASTTIDNYVYHHSKFAYAADPLLVEVPEGVFAREPSESTKRWVNWLWTDKAYDQCQWRRKLIFSVTVQPIIFLAWFLFIFLLTLLSGLCLHKNWTWKNLSSPLETNLERMLDMGNAGSLLVEPEKESLLRMRRLAAYVSLIILGLGYLTHTLWFASAVVLGCVVVLSVMIGIAWLLNHLHNFKKDNLILEKIKPSKKIIPKWYLEQEEQELLVCSPNNTKSLKINQLPSKHRTVKLRYQDLKSKICKPFAG